MQDYSKYFPYKHNNPDLIYFDNASTTQKPQVVIEEVNNYLSNCCANPYRGNYRQADHIQKVVEEVRRKVAKFVNADPSEIFFTFGSSDGIEKFVANWICRDISDDEEILYCPHDHKSLIEPFLRSKLQVRLIPYAIFEHAGDADWRDILNKATSKTKLIVITHIHSAYGLQAELDKLRGKLSPETMIFLDATQSAGHVKIDVQRLGVDAMVFPGHKMFALEGIGVLYLSKRMQNIISKRGLEFGTLPISGIISLGKAIDFIVQIGIEQIHLYCMDLTQYLLTELRKLPNIEFLPGVANAKCATGYGIISFRVHGISSDDVSFVFDSQNICVRSGNNCLSDPKSVENSIRVSLHINNTKEEIDQFIKVLGNLVNQI